VVLRFSKEAAPRVKETRWHASERTRTLPDGRLEWRAEVAEWREMLHWIRGWGAEVEAVAPAGLREAVAEDARRLAEMYR
jgi:CRISPR-associated endonuclease/helicase Cas3